MEDKYDHTIDSTNTHNSAITDCSRIEIITEELNNVFDENAIRNSDIDLQTDTFTFAKNMDEILTLKKRKIAIMNSLEEKALYEMNKAKLHFKEKSKMFIQEDQITYDNDDDANANDNDNIRELITAVMQHSNKSIRSIIDREPDNIIVQIESEDMQYNDEVRPREKMQSCGTWCDGFCFFCNILKICCLVCSNIPFCGCKIFAIQLKKLYFFMLYLFTGELNPEAIDYKNFFNVKSKKDDQVNVPEIIVTAGSIVFELYKTLIGSFLTVFTAQRCGSQTCTIWENIVPKNELELVGIICNFLMASALLIEYFLEITREAYLIKYLNYDNSLANNGEHIAEIYENANKKIFMKLIPLYMIYIRFSYVVLFIYFVNVGLSATIIASNYYDNTSIFSFVTNALFIIYKMYSVVEITSYRGNYFYSAYKRQNIHYNTIKPKYLLKLFEEIGEYKNFENFGEYGEKLSLESNNDIFDIEQPQIKNKKQFVKEYIPKRFVSPVIEDGEHLSSFEKEEVLQDLFEKNYIDKGVYRKLTMFLRKSGYGDLELHNE
jgi:hypothetical protein